jgi:predicted O-linked N-acetylglucosamine transferase (SPINDLY family)
VSAASGGAPSPVSAAARAAELFRAGRPTELESLARQMIAAAPAAAAGWSALGAALAMQERHADALVAKARALEIAPDAQAHSNLASTLLALARVDDAIRHARRAVELDARIATAHGNLGLALLAKGGQHDEAAACCRRALALDAGLHGVRARLATHLHARGEWREAAQLLTEGVRRRPDDCKGWLALGNVLRDQQDMVRAAAAFRQALKLQPALHEAWNNLGNTLHDLGRLQEAETAFRRALALEAAVGAIHSNLGNVLRELGRFEEAATCYRMALGADPGFLGAHDNLLLALNYTEGPRPAERLAEARRFGAAAARLATPLPRRTVRGPGALRVGLVSGDMRNHPVGYFLEGVLRAINPDRIRAVAYSTQPREDALTARLRKHVGWRRIDEMTDAQAAHLIRADDIDVLLDLSGHTAHNRLPLFCWRAAPVQATWLGYFATTGVAEIDYLIADAHSVPADTQELFTETVWRLPRSRLCFTPTPEAPDVSSLPALANGHVTFGSFQALAKITDAVLALWARVLQSVPDAQLRVQSPQLGDEATREALRQRMRAQGLDPARTRLHGRSSRLDYFKAHAEVDMLLDTFPFPGGTTTCEALWMGVPTVTLEGERLIARQGSALLAAAGLREWIARDQAEFVRIAAQWAADLDALAGLRGGLRGRVEQSALFDAPGFAQDFTDALMRIRASQR